MKTRLKHACIGIGQYGANVPASRYVSDGFRFLRTTDIDDDGTLRTSNDGVFIEASDAKGYHLRRGDLLFSRSGTIGRGYLHNAGPEQNFAFAGYLVRFTPSPDAEPRFLFYTSRSAPFQQQIQADSIQTTISNFNAEKYGNLEIWLPPLLTQRAIADFLDRKTAAIDDLIAKKERLLGLLAEKRAALIHRAVTRGLDPTVPMKDSGVPWIGKIPAHWAFCRLSFRYEQQLGKMLSPMAAEGPHQAPYLGNKDVQWDRVDVSDLKTMSFSAADRAKFSLRLGDLLVCEGGMVGRTAVWREELAECYFQKAIHRLRPLQRATEDPRFFYYCMTTAVERGLFEEQGNKATISHLTGEALRAHRFPFPPAHEQRSIALWLDSQATTLDELDRRVTQQLERLREYRQALITAAVTGQLDVSQFESDCARVPSTSDEQLGMFGGAP